MDGTKQGDPRAQLTDGVIYSVTMAVGMPAIPLPITGAVRADRPVFESGSGSEPRDSAQAFARRVRVSWPAAATRSSSAWIRSRARWPCIGAPAPPWRRRLRVGAATALIESES